MLVLGASFFVLPYSEGYLGGDRTIYQRVSEFWGGYTDWEHCKFVPVICIGLIWLERKKIINCPLAPNYLGWPVLVTAAFCYWFGSVGDQHYAGFFSVQIMMVGLIITLFGLPLMKVLFFPWFFLGFMWPLLFLESMLAFPLRILMSEISYHFLNLIGVEVVLRGTGLLSAADPGLGLATGEKFSVDIADPCSGIRSLFALMMVSALYAYFSLKPSLYKCFRYIEKLPAVGELLLVFVQNWKRWTLFACSLPLAVAGNFIRILMLTFGTMWFGSDFAIGSLDDPSTFHMIAGFFVFIVALGGMLLISKLLQKTDLLFTSKDS